MVLAFGDHRLDINRRELRRGAELVDLPPKAFDLLAFLVQHRDRVVSKDDLLRGVWGGRIVSESAITTRINAVRRALGDDGTAQHLVRTFVGKGVRFVGAVQEHQASGEPVTRGFPPRLSIVVLPFTNLSNDQGLEHFADAVTDDLTTDLARIPDSFVIARITAFTYKRKAVDVRQVARELGVRYVLEGSVRRLGERLQLNVQLLDGETGSHVWADRSDTDWHDLAEAQRVIVGRLASQLAVELIRDVGRRIEQENVADPDASVVALRAAAFRVQTLSSDGQARQAMVALLKRALILNPGSVDARIQFAAILVTAVADGVSTSMEQDKARIEQLISEALERVPNRSDAHRVMGMLRRCQARWAESQMELERALELDPNNAIAINQLGITLLAQGEPDAAMPHFERAIRTKARYRTGYNVYVNLGRCHLFSIRMAQAVELLRRGRTLGPSMWYVHLDLAGALGLVGNLEEAKSEIAEAVRLKPEIDSIARWRALAVRQGFGHPQFQALREKTTYAGLRAAGFPEE